MGAFIDYTGQRFGRLVVEKRIGTRTRGIKYPVKTPLWLCSCDCGKTKEATSAELRIGDTKSCGCLAVDMLRERSTTHGDGHKESEYYRLYHIWTKMKDRCENPNDAAYVYYGERGIRLCDEWHNYEVFKKWALKNGYRTDLTIDRIDFNGDYSPDNCRWADFKIQSNNRSSCRYITIGDETKTIQEWCEHFGTNPFTAYSRIDRFGWNPIKAVSLPPQKKHYYKDVMEA